MKTYTEILETKQKIKTVKVKLFYDSKNYDTLYTATDGKNFILNNDKSVYWDDDKDAAWSPSGIGKPNAKNPEFDVMKFQGKLGVYDSNMNLIQGYKNMRELSNDIDDFMFEEDIVLLNWES